MRKLIVGSALVAGFAVFAIAATALATVADKVTSTPLAQGNADMIDVKVKTGDWKVALDTKGPSTLAVAANFASPPAVTSAGTAILGPARDRQVREHQRSDRGDDPDCTPESAPLAGNCLR